MRPNKTFLTILSLCSVMLVGCEQPLPPTASCILPENATKAQLAEADNQTTDTKAGSESEAQRVCVLPESSLEANLEINANLRNFSIAKEQKMRDALERLKIVINSEEFKQEILSHTFNGEYSFANNNGLTNDEIYEVILRGAETLMPEEDEEIDVDITLYYSNNSTVGYTYPDSTRIWVNDKFFSGFTLGKVAANVAHEWTHKIGFGHDFNRTAIRPYSVPYGVGSIIQKLVDGM